MTGQGFQSAMPTSGSSGRAKVVGGSRHNRGCPLSTEETQASWTYLDTEVKEWVALVKAEQKLSSDVRKRWRDYCDVLGHGIRDPSLHDAAFLSGFFELSAAGQIPKPLHTVSMPDLDSDVRQAHAILAAKVKQGLKVPAFKKAWKAYTCNSLGTRDPLLHDNASLRQFLLDVAPQDMMAATKDPYAIPAPHTSHLSECVRFMQSKKLGWKRQWDDFSDARGGGIRDPARHHENILWEFIMQAKPQCPLKNLPSEYRALMPKNQSTAFVPEPVFPPGLGRGYLEGVEYSLAFDACRVSECSTADSCADSGSCLPYSVQHISL